MLSYLNEFDTIKKILYNIITVRRKGETKVELLDMFDALETIKDLCVTHDGNCSECELRRSPFCKNNSVKLKDLTIIHPNEKQVFSFFD